MAMPQRHAEFIRPRPILGFPSSPGGGTGDDDPRNNLLIRVLNVVTKHREAVRNLLSSTWSSQAIPKRPQGPYQDSRKKENADDTPEKKHTDGSEVNENPE